MDIKAVLDLPIEDEDSGSTSIKDYLRNLLLILWEEEEGFSGKTPFGNSGWQRNLYVPLIKFGVIEGDIDEYGCIDNYNRSQAWDIIYKCIEEMCKPQ